uniref:coiled-coil domain-containing protein 171 n=1 Tax=Lonchura striata TaxID=40157 RepID=UPI001292DC01|nr:coiled-coil domain-containing protein 171 [Lonchura striata domestica]
MSHCEKEIMKLKLELERGEVLHQRLESEMSFAKKQAHMQMSSAENKLWDAKSTVLELQAVLDGEYQQKAEAEKMVESAQRQWEEEQQRLAVERDNIHRAHLAELEFLFKERTETEKASQKTNAALQSMLKKFKDMEVEHHGCSKMLRLQADHLYYKDKRQETLIKDLEAATLKIKELEENTSAARLAHIECKYTIETMQLRIQELEDALNEERLGREGFSGVARKDFRESENAHERGKKVLRGQRSSLNVQWRDEAEARKKAEESSRTFVDTIESFTVEEGSIREMSVLLNLYQSMANAHVLAKHSDTPLEELPWTELCALLCENVEALILNFHKAKERISQLEYICKHKTDTVNDLQQKQEDAFEKMSEQLKAQEHCWQKEKQYLEQHYSNILAEIHARAQECEETVQKNRQKLYGLEQIREKLAHENYSMTNTLSNAYKARSSLLAACALLSGALCPLYSRLGAVSCQRDILQEQVKHHRLLNQKIISLLYALPTNVGNSQVEGRLGQRRAKNLVYIFRRAVIAVLAANRLRALAQYSCTFFVWTDGSRGCTGIQVCVGESRGRHMSRFEEEGVDCIEALDWLTSSNLYTVIISSISELEDVLSTQDVHSWLSGHSLISAARNCFAKLMDSLSILMETVQGKPCGCRAYLERDSLIQRLARGLHRVNAQALEAGLYDRLPSTRNIAILQQEIFEFSRRLHAAEVESRSLHLQLAECRWALSEMQKDAEKAHSLQEQLNELQHKFNQDNIHEELDYALQREQQARSLLQEHQRRLQELSNRLELHSFASPDRSQVADVSLLNLPNATEQLRSRDQVLYHQKRLLEDTEQDQQQLQETLEEAEPALKLGVKDKELLINHMKAVEDALNEAKEEAVAGAAAATPLPSLQLKTLSEEAVRGKPEALSFQHVLRHFMDLYSLAASKVKALTSGRESSQIHFEPLIAEPLTPAADEPLQVHFEPKTGDTPPAPAPVPAPDESFWGRIGHQLARTPPAHAGASDDSFGPQFVPKGAAAPPAPAPHDIFRVSVAPRAPRTPATPVPAPADIFQPYVSPQAAGRPPAPISAADGRWRVPIHRAHSVSGANVPAAVEARRTYSASDTNVPSSVTPGRFYSVSETNIPSSVMPGRTGFGSSMDRVINPKPTRINTGSSVDASSRMRGNRALTVPSSNVSSIMTGNRAGTGSSVNKSFSFRPRRASSLPSVRTSSQDVLLSTRKSNEI